MSQTAGMGATNIVAFSLEPVEGLLRAIGAVAGYGISLVERGVSTTAARNLGFRKGNS